MSQSSGHISNLQSSEVITHFSPFRVRQQSFVSSLYNFKCHIFLLIWVEKYFKCIHMYHFIAFSNFLVSISNIYFLEHYLTRIYRENRTRRHRVSKGNIQITLIKVKSPNYPRLIQYINQCFLNFSYNYSS